MTALSYRMEILAEDINEAPGVLWTRDIIERNRAIKTEILDRIVVAVDPPITSTGDEAGIVTASKKGDHGYLIADDSRQGSSLE